MTSLNLIAELGERAAPGFAEFFENASSDIQERIASQFNEFGIETLFKEFHDAMAHDKALKAGASSEVEIIPPPKLSFKELDHAFKTKDSLPAKTLSLSSMNGDEITSLESIGLDALKAGKVAIIILAGGQGSRLGFSGPKGAYELNLPSKSSIYKILMYRIAALRRILGSSYPPVYIMTSEQNDSETREHFKKNDFFGLGEETVKFFIQTVIPSFDMKTGAVLFDSETTLTRNSNGNGGIFSSLKKTGMLDDMKKHGVEYIHVHGIDNVIVKSGDPLFLGACIKADVGAGNKCCTKIQPSEKVGVQVNKKVSKGGAGQGDHASVVTICPSVVEYTEISESQANEREKDGSLKFSSANIVNHFFRLKDLLEIDMKYHVAVKKVSFYDFQKKALIKPTEPNAVKLEYFIFDAFENMSNLLVFEANRDEEFSPVKNADGSDSPATACRDIGLLHKKYLTAAGLVSADSKELYEIELGATYAGEGLTSATQFKSFTSNA